jgi:hypothetical protein
VTREPPSEARGLRREAATAADREPPSEARGLRREAATAVDRA